MHWDSDLIADFQSRAYARLLGDDGDWSGLEKSMAPEKASSSLGVSRTEREKRNESEESMSVLSVSFLSFCVSFSSNGVLFFHPFRF